MHGYSRIRVTYSGVASTLALVIALSTGGAYAASLIGTAQIKNGAVTTPKIANGAVKNAKIANGSVGNAKIANSAVGNAKLANGAVSLGKLAPALSQDIVPPWGTIPSGKIVSGAFSTDTSSGDAADLQRIYLVLPADAPVALANENLGFGPATNVTADARCGGSLVDPAPDPGMFCVYFGLKGGLHGFEMGTRTFLGGKRVVSLAAYEDAANSDVYWTGAWAYRAP